MMTRLGGIATTLCVLAATTACTEAGPGSKTLDAGHAVYTAERTDLAENAEVFMKLYDMKRTTASVRITGPRYGLNFEYVFVVASLTGRQAFALDLSDDRETGVTAGPGRELVIAFSGAGATTLESVKDSAPEPAVVLKSGDAGRTVKDLPLVTEEGGQLVASIPAGSEPLLAATELGRTQTLSLRTGDRGGYSPAAYYPLRRGKAQLFSPGIGTRVPLIGYLSRFDIDARLGAYSVQRGWARPGHAWLLLTILYRGTSSPADPTGWRVEFDLGKALTVRGKGLPAHPLKNRIQVLEIAENGLNAAVEVADPALLGDITFTLTSGGTLVSAAGGRPRTQQITASSDVILRMTAKQ